MKRLLLVDDEPRNIALLVALLAPLGYELAVANDGTSALARFHEDVPDLVLLDVAMPRQDGIEVLRAIRARKGPKEYVPVILVTAHSERAVRVRGLEAGADEFLERPIDGPILIARVRNLLELKESRDLMAARHEALERLQRDQRDLTNFIVHDLKSPLSVAALNVEFARSTIPDPSSEGALSLDDAKEALVRLTEMIQDLLLVAQLDAADFTIQPSEIAMNDLLRRILKDHSRLAAKMDIAIEVVCADVLAVYADKVLLRRVIENLLENALRHTPRSGHILVASRADQGVEIAVRNTGKPIPTIDRERIFDKFVRGEDRSEGIGNAGLGLYFCKRAVEALGGVIELSVTPEWPTSFVVHLPA